MFSRGLPSLLLCSAGFCILTVPPFIGLSDVISSQSELKEFLRANQPIIYSIAQNRNIVGIENSKSTFIYVVFCWATIVLLLYSATLTYCVYGCYASLQRGKSAFSSRTLMLYRSLVNALMIDVAICGVMVILPVVLCGLSMYFQLEWASTATLLAMSFASWYPCVSHIVWMWFIAPYRRALIRMFKGRGRTAQDKNSNVFLQLSAIS
ncbi:serpentine type 7TM GPCR chemoreceptor srh domain-containing protein [Ditylenchus destructor]|nr:serpentine type 7TM GPCR chemoreceptor srh domain-containing protein [Ditylenchus destructor]